ncbi:MAG: helix-turn-helix transcriptional regulator [Gaiella sp.]
MSGRWTFLSHHAHVLLCIARDPDVRLREVATEVGITERAVQAIVNDLVEEGYVTRVRVGRRNHYEIDTSSPLRHPMQSDVDVGALLRVLEAERSRSTHPTVAATQPA